MQNEKTQSTKVLWGFGIAIAVLIGLFLFREQWNRILFCLDIRYWPVWAPRLLWLLVGLMILNLLTTEYFLKHDKPCDVTDSAAIKQSVKVDRSVLLSSIKRFALFLLVIEALRLSGYKLSVLFYPFFKMYRYFFGCYSFYFDFGTHTFYQQSIMRLKPFIPLPVFIITLTSLILILWYCFGRKRGYSLYQYIGVLIKGAGHLCLKICRWGLIGQIPIFYIICGFFSIVLLFLQWGLSAFYRKPLEFYMSTGVLSWRLLLVPILIITLLILTAKLFRKKKTAAVVLAAQKKGSHYPPPGTVMAYSRPWIEAGWQILLPLVLVLILGLVQRRLTKRLQTNGVQ